MFPEIAQRISSSLGIGVLGEERLGHQHHARRAEAALQAVLLLEARLDRVRAPPAGASPSTVVIAWPSAWTANIVHDFTGTPSSEHRAGAAARRVAADVGARQPESLAEEVDEEQPCLDVGGARLRR